MEFHFTHNNFNVLDLDRSIAFYEKALGLKEHRRINGNGCVIAFLTDGKTEHELELTWLERRKRPYDLGENEFHLAMRVKDFNAAHELHKELGCICYENTDMGIYCISDPDGYWIEILPEK